MSDHTPPVPIRWDQLSWANPTDEARVVDALSRAGIVEVVATAADDATITPYATVAHVFPGELIEAAWGNALVDEVNNSLKVSGTPPVVRIRLTTTSDAALDSTNHAFQIGPDDAGNLIADTQEIMARYDGAPTTLVLNGEGGTVLCGGEVVGERGRFLSTAEATLVSEDNALQIGPTNAFNLAFDPNEIQARVDGAASNLTINAQGGRVTAGADLQAVDNVFTTAGNLFAGKSATDLDVVGCEVRPTGLVAASNGVAGGYNFGAFHLGAADATGEKFFNFARGTGATMIGSITQATASTVAYNTSSDYRLKDELGPVPDAAGRINALRPIHFAWKADGVEENGFLAHEVADVVPSVVTGDKDAVDVDGNIVPQQLNLAGLVPLLVAALQDALARIAVLEGGAG